MAIGIRHGGWNGNGTKANRYRKDWFVGIHLPPDVSRPRNLHVLRTFVVRLFCPD